LNTGHLLAAREDFHREAGKPGTRERRLRGLPIAASLVATIDEGVRASISRET
jgi:hypothetical protein